MQSVSTVEIFDVNISFRTKSRVGVLKCYILEEKILRRILKKLGAMFAMLSCFATCMNNWNCYGVGVVVVVVV